MYFKGDCSGYCVSKLGAPYDLPQSPIIHIECEKNNNNRLPYTIIPLNERKT